MPALPLLLAAAVTGAAGLAAETLWIRALARTLGGTGEALAAVSAVFLAGLGAGAALGGRWAARSERPARRAAGASLLAGAWLAASPRLLGVAGRLGDALLDGLGMEGTPAAGVAALAAAPVLLPPAVLLGLLLPLLVRARAAAPGSEGRWSGALYAAGTVGGAVGAPAALLLLGTLGERAALGVAGAACVAASLLLLLAEAPPVAPAGAAPTVAARGVRALACGAGFAALLAQGAWLRLLGPLAGSHAWGTAFLLASALASTAVGAWAGSALVRRGRGAPLPALFATAGAALLLSLPAAGLVAWLLLTLGAGGGAARLLALGAGVLGTVAPASLLLGATYPLLVRRAVAADAPAGPATGEVFGWNAAGSVLGSLAAGFFLLPRLGGAGTLLLAGGVLALAAVARVLAGPSPRRAAAACAAALPLAAVAIPPVQVALLDAAPTPAEAAAAAEPLPLPLRLRSPRDVEIYADLFFGPTRWRSEGRTGAAAILEETGAGLRLRRGESAEGRIDPADPSRPSRTELALALLPAAMHRSPATALVLGHGAGWTAEALLRAGVGRVDVVEFDEAVLDVVERARGPLAVRSAPGARLRLEDGRRALRRSARAAARFDLILSQPSRPWSAGSAALFTEEAFHEARGALAESGVLAQWIDLAASPPGAVPSLLAAFGASFPAVWGFGFGEDLVLLGFAGTPRIDPARWDAVLRAAGDERAGLADAPALFKHFAFDDAGLRRLLEGAGPPSTDDRPRVELDLALARFAGRAPSVEPVLAPLFPPDVAAALPDAAVRETWCRRATAAWLRDGDVPSASRWSARVPWGAGPDAKRVRGEVARAEGDLARAEQFHRAAAQEAQDRPDLLAAWLRSVGAVAAAEPAGGRERLALVQAAARAAERFPAHGEVLAALGRMWADASFYEPARDADRRALAATAPPAPPGTGAHLARLLLAANEADDATLLGLLRDDPGALTDREPLELLWRIETRAGRPKEADLLGAALRDLDERLGRERLAEARRALRRGDVARAVALSAALPTMLSEDPQAWTERALALLAWHHGPGLAHAAQEGAVREALDALARAVHRDAAPEEARTRARALLSWFDVDPARLPDAPPELP